MEKKQFKKLPLADISRSIPDEMLETVSGGKQNTNEDGTEWDKNVEHAQKWQYDQYHTKFYMECPHCGRYMFYSMQTYSSDTWWYCFWYNRLWCTNCRKWTDELY